LHNHIKLLLFLRTPARFVYEYHNNHNYKISSIIVAATAPLQRPLPLFHPLVPFHKTVVIDDGEKNIQPPTGVDGQDKCLKSHSPTGVTKRRFVDLEIASRSLGNYDELW
jgi:hypothetical protein